VETIRLLVRNLVFLVMLAAFLEMLLPLQGTRRFVQVIIGLFVMLAVLGPIVTLFKQPSPLHFALPATTGDGAGLSKILEQGQGLQQVTAAQEQSAYVQRLEDQIEVMCRLVPGVKSAKADVVLTPESPLQSLGTVQKVAVSLQTGEQQVARPVEPVRIGQGSPTISTPVVDQQGIAAQVQETVSSLFGLPKEQVTVNFVNQR